MGSYFFWWKIKNNYSKANFNMSICSIKKTYLKKYIQGIHFIKKRSKDGCKYNSNDFLMNKTN